ncbi:VOC family protein [Aquidulcibacter sp.]|uniref:VOC family protein n=1 Tax=Aquidulcibacter sp. TaxID=2052990 RepID=UPI0025C2B0B2|nr:VOC family protein [Aquidulcibacter sp.]MCA3691819.1 VOC family protein [Aquidulcibacter sp.]
MRLCGKMFIAAIVVAASTGLGIAVAQQATPATQSVEPAKDPTKIATPSERVPIDIRRTTIIVRDMETSLKLYRDALGMRVNYDERMNVSSPAFAQGGPPRPIRLVLLNANDPWIGWIGLIQYTDRPDHPKVKQPKVLGPGSHIIVASVADAQKACDAAKAAPGVRLVVEPKVSVYPPRIPGAPPIRVLGCQFFDADGAYLELNQTLPQ